MSLFVGNISRNLESKDLERIFNEFGSVKIDFRVKNIKKLIYFLAPIRIRDILKR